MFVIDAILCTLLIGASRLAERAVSPRDGGVWWVVLDAELVVHREASAFLACLQGADRSPHIPAAPNRELREHEPADVAADFLLGGLPVVSRRLGQAADPGHPPIPPTPR